MSIKISAVQSGAFRCERGSITAEAVTLNFPVMRENFIDRVVRRAIKRSKYFVPVLAPSNFEDLSQKILQQEKINLPI